MLPGKFQGKKTPVTPLQGSLGPPKKNVVVFYYFCVIGAWIPLSVFRN